MPTAMKEYDGAAVVELGTRKNGSLSQPIPNWHHPLFTLATSINNSFKDHPYYNHSLFDTASRIKEAQL
jgi:hypothetical protein